MATTLKNRQLTFNSPQGYLINGKISVTVASNNLTVAIKTLAGNDPSASDPVYCRIGDTVRSITAALSVTKNAGTNWCNSGGSELATKEVDYFVYLGYNATDGTVIGFSRIPYVGEYSEFSTTTTNEKYCAISTITNAAAGDDYEVVGRFAATLSAGAGYTWTVPTFTNINLIQRPIYETRWLTWQPIYAGSGSMTYTSVTTHVARYQIRGGTLFYNFLSEGTTGGSASNALTATFPFDIASAIAGASQNCNFSAHTYDGGYKSGIGMITAATPDKLVVYKYDGSNWALAATKIIGSNSQYEI